MMKMWVLVVFLAAGAVEVHPQASELACHAAAIEQQRLAAARVIFDVEGAMCVLADVDADLAAETLEGLAP